MKPPRFMIMPSMACQAACSYCFGPHEGAVMDERTARAVVSFIQSVAGDAAMGKVSITFHGGEPLLAPLAVWRALLEEIRAQMVGINVKLSIQSNLWNLTDEYLSLFSEHGVGIGTSLDGPEKICEINRGSGYFKRTWDGVRLARESGCQVSAIATVAKETLPYVEEIAEFFLDEQMPLDIHCAIDSMDCTDKAFALSADEYAGMVRELFPWYARHRKSIKIGTLDNYARAIVFGDPVVCTMKDCFGTFLAIAPDGDITSCQRLAGKKEYALGNIFSAPSLETLYASPAALAHKNREKTVKEHCSGCGRYAVCKGGCYYSALASGDGVLDPWCEAYKRIYDFVQEQVIEEMRGAENLYAVNNEPVQHGEHPLMRRGAYISLANEVHPAEIAANARQILAWGELGKTEDLDKAARNLYDRKICGDPQVTKQVLYGMRNSLSGNADTLNNCYIHVTDRCNLRCTHCYAWAGENSHEMPIDNFRLLTEQAIASRFRQIVVTGGEPLIYTDRTALLSVCKNAKGRGCALVLRTNLTGCYSESELSALGQAFDQIVVSVDGDKETHDARRGNGTYDNVTANCERYQQVVTANHGFAELSIAAVMGSGDINGPPGESVRLLSKELGVKRVKFRPLLPLGRAAGMAQTDFCEGLPQHIPPDERLKTEFRPLMSCGIGQNLYIQPDGSCFPCYAWCASHALLGNAFDIGLDHVLSSRQYKRLQEYTVDTIDRCRDCAYRYLCGGACRAWGNQNAPDLNAGPQDCSNLQQNAQTLLQAAEAYLV